jgi:hypothetical protein
MVAGISKSTEGKRQHPDMGPGMRKHRNIGEYGVVGSLPTTCAEVEAAGIHGGGGNASSGVEKHEE